MKSDEKECPFCFEVIKAKAVKCRFCGSRLEMRRTTEDALGSDATGEAPNYLGTGEIAELLETLVSRSLAIFDETSGRYRILETVRQYARERLLESGEGDTWRNRHLAHFVAFAEPPGPNRFDQEHLKWLERLDTEHDNIRAALEWSESAIPAASLKLAGTVWQFWQVRGHLSEGRERLSRVLTNAPCAEKTDRAKALNGAGILAYLQSDFAAARAHHEERLAIVRDLGDRRGIAISLGNLAIVVLAKGDYATARKLTEESLAIHQQLGNQRDIALSLSNLGFVALEQGDHAAARELCEESLEISRGQGDLRGIALSLANLGLVAYGQGDYAAARERHEQSLAICREQGDRGAIAEQLCNLGNVAYEQGDYAAARKLLIESLGIYRLLGDRRGIAESLEGIGAVSMCLGTPSKAAELWGAAEQLREEIGSPLSPNERPRHDRQVAAARVALGDDAAFDSEWRVGRAMSLDRAIELALEVDSPGPSQTQTDWS